MMPVSQRFAFLLILVLGLPCSTVAKGPYRVPALGRPLIVATKEAPPFAFKNPEGLWQGLSIELWEQLAHDLDLDYEYVEHTLPELIESVEEGRADVGISAITITPNRESRLDFTYSYYDGGVGVAIAASRESLIFELLRRLVSWNFLSAVAALAGILLAAGFLVWLFEKRANPNQFGGSRLQGLGSSFWWSAVTMTTVGYGDKAPKSPGGRAVALVWMFTSIIIISSFTAGIASSLTASQVAADYLRNTPIDSLLVATVNRSTGDDLAEKMGLRHQSFPDLQSALEAVETKKAQAIIYDQPLLKHHLRLHPSQHVEILPHLLVHESYGIALPPGSPFRESLNLALLETLRSPGWETLRGEYLGMR